MKEEDKKYLTAFLVGAVILIILRELFDKSKKRTSDYVATGLIGGALGAGAYALCRKKEKEEAPENLIAYNGDPREFFKTKLFKRIIFDNVTGYKSCKIGKYSLPYCNEADLQSTSNLFYCRFFDIETYENCLNDLFNNEATFRVYNPEYNEDGWQLASERVKSDLAAVTTTHRVNSPFTIASHGTHRRCVRCRCLCVVPKERERRSL